MVGTPRGAKARFLKAPVSLSAQDVIEITAAASKPETWTSTQPTQGGKPPVESPFDAGEVCKCGGTMVQRERRVDGAKFLGCSRYPKCRRTLPAKGSD